MKVDMSIQAIITRLKRVSQLRTLCLLLNKTREIPRPRIFEDIPFSGRIGH